MRIGSLLFSCEKPFIVGSLLVINQNLLPILPVPIVNFSEGTLGRPRPHCVWTTDAFSGTDEKNRSYPKKCAASAGIQRVFVCPIWRATTRAESHIVEASPAAINRRPWSTSGSRSVSLRWISTAHRTASSLGGPPMGGDAPLAVRASLPH